MLVVAIKSKTFWQEYLYAYICEEIPQRDMSHKNVIETLHQYVATHLPAGAEAFLYGSRARNEAHTSSDWDVLILLDKSGLENDDYVNVSYPLMLLGCEIGETINPIMYTRKEWQRNSFTPFYHNVLKDAIRL